MRIAVVSDEISDDLEEAVQLGSLLQVGAYELRWVRLPGEFRRRRVGELSMEEAGAAAEVIQRGGASVSAIAPGLFNTPWGDAGALDAQMARLKRSIELAEALRAHEIVVHGFLPPEGRRNGVCPPAVIETLAHAAERARAAGTRLLLRNMCGTYADTGAHTAAIVHAVHSEALGVSWDPCHAARMGEAAISEGYEWVAPFVGDVRVKDQAERPDLGFEYTVLAQGSMDWPAQLRALARDGYQGMVTLGTRLEPPLLNTMHSLEALRKLLKSL